MKTSRIAIVTSGAFLLPTIFVASTQASNADTSLTKVANLQKQVLQLTSQIKALTGKVESLSKAPGNSTALQSRATTTITIKYTAIRRGTQSGACGDGQETFVSGIRIINENDNNLIACSVSFQVLK